MFKKGSMEYRRLGGSGLLVSVLSYGNFNSDGVISFEDQVKIIKACFENGINFIDTAELYSEGRD